MRLHPVMVSAAILALTAFLHIQSTLVNDINENHSRVISLLTQLDDADHLISRQVFGIRYLRYHNFDVLRDAHNRFNRTMAALQSPELGTLLSGSTKFDFLLRQLTQDQGRKWLLMEHFLTDVAVMKNSLAYFSSSRLVSGEILPFLDELPVAKRDLVETDVRRLQRDILVLSNSLGNELFDAVDRSLQRLANTASQLRDRDRKNLLRLFRHAQLVVDNRQSLDKLISQIEAINTSRTVDQLTEVYLARHADEEHSASLYRHAILALILLITFYLLTLLIRQRTTGRHLLRERAIRDFVLSAIADGVIITDGRDRVVQMNRIAENLTGWPEIEARGEAADTVLPIFSEVTRSQLESPSERAVTEGRTLKFQDHFQLRNRSDEIHRILLTASPIPVPGETNPGALLVFRDVSQPAELARELTFQKQHDILTGLYNRNSFELHLVEALAKIANHPGESFALFSVNLDHFKLINETCGNHIGDRTLKQVGAAMHEVLGSASTIARLGNDEFAALVAVDDPTTNLDIACRLRETINQLRFEDANRLFEVEVTIGVVFVTGDMVSVTDILGAARAAVESARNGGRNRIHVYQEDDSEQGSARGAMQWIPIIRKALEQDHYDLYLQPIMPTESTDSVPERFEVLVRMKTEDQGPVSPGIFIPAAERYNMMSQIDRWVVARSFALHAAELHRAPAYERRHYSINLSGASLSEAYFLDFIRKELEAQQLDPTHFCFEITETATIANLKAALYFISEMRNMGFFFAIDDFGSGLSSYTYIKNIPISQLKIDGSFVRELPVSPISEAIVESVQQISRVLNAETVAEFVENDAILQRLRQIGVDYVQGYGIAQPRPWNHFDV